MTRKQGQGLVELSRQGPQGLSEAMMEDTPDGHLGYMSAVKDVTGCSVCLEAPGAASRCAGASLCSK